jgi:hypothetical protein
VPDRLYLSTWVRGFAEHNMLRHFETLLNLFPSSKLAKRGPVLRVYAIDHAEPPASEREFLPGAEAADIARIARETAAPDCAFEVETAWDLWQYDTDWNLRPAAVTLIALGPEFENEIGDHLRIEFGLDSRFLPIEGMEESLKMGQSNLRSLLHLVNQIEGALPLDRRHLWSESGANFADLLKETVTRFQIN